jgi:predicted Rossmann fold flavoprotein
VSNRARDVRDGLVALAQAKGVEIQSQTSATGLEALGSGSAGNEPRWRLTTSRGNVDASQVIMATGGLSVPLTGSDGTGLVLAQQLGHRIHPTYPALTPLTGTTPLLAALSGISVNVRIRAKRLRQTSESHGGFLFTHRGFSGPSVLDVSHIAVRSRMGAEPQDRATLRVQWTDRDAETWARELTAAQGLIVNLVARHLPERLAEVLCLEAGLPPDRRGPELRRQERTALVEALTAYALPWSGDEGYKKAEVTGGGVALTDINPRTLESLRQPGLFLCGEMLDAFGPIGGYNFAWAWATGRAAGLGAAARPGR